MRKIAVEQLQQLQRAINDDDVISDDVTSASQVDDQRRCAVAACVDDGDRLQATNEPPQ